MEKYEKHFTKIQNQSRRPTFSLFIIALEVLAKFLGDKIGRNERNASWKESHIDGGNVV